MRALFCIAKAIDFEKYAYEFVCICNGSEEYHLKTCANPNNSNVKRLKPLGIKLEIAACECIANPLLYMWILMVEQ
jgi:hypothetical protein